VKIGDTVIVDQNGSPIEATISFIEHKSGFRGYPYKVIHVEIGGREYVYRDWDVIDKSQSNC
jgi:hypothetical protein